MSENKNTEEIRRRNADKDPRHENLYYVTKWGITEKQLEEAIEQTNSRNEQELYSYLTTHGYIS